MSERRNPVITQDVARKIETLVETMEKPTAGKIARRLGLKQGTVYWFLLSRNLVNKPPPRYSQKVYVRNGQTIYPYSRECDARLIELRTQRKSRREIAAALTAEFGIPRTAHSIETRLVILTATEDESEAV